MKKKSKVPNFEIKETVLQDRKLQLQWIRKRKQELVFLIESAKVSINHFNSRIIECDDELKTLSQLEKKTKKKIK
jgi:hypothetical protein